MIKEEARPGVQLPDGVHIFMCQFKLKDVEVLAIQSFAYLSFNLKAILAPYRSGLILMSAGEPTIRRYSRIIGRSCKSGQVDLPLAHEKANMHV